MLELNSLSALEISMSLRVSISRDGKGVRNKESKKEIDLDLHHTFNTADSQGWIGKRGKG